MTGGSPPSELMFDRAMRGGIPPTEFVLVGTMEYRPPLEYLLCCVMEGGGARRPRCRSAERWRNGRRTSFRSLGRWGEGWERHRPCLR